MTVPEESDAVSLLTGTFPLALVSLMLGVCFSSDEDASESLESSLLDDELVLSEPGSFAAESDCDESESSEADEDSWVFLGLLDTLAFLFGRSSSEESEVDPDDDSDELLSAFRLRLFVAAAWSLGFADVVVESTNLELRSLSSSASLSEEDDDEDDDEDEEEDDEDEDEDDDEDDEEENDRARFATCLTFTLVLGFFFFLGACSELDESSVLLSLLLELVDAFDVFGVSSLTEDFF